MGERDCRKAVYLCMVVPLLRIRDLGSGAFWIRVGKNIRIRDGEKIRIRDPGWKKNPDPG